MIVPSTGGKHVEKSEKVNNDDACFGMSVNPEHTAA
jgi:hypothetical protein